MGSNQGNVCLSWSCRGQFVLLTQPEDPGISQTEWDLGMEQGVEARFLLSSS